MDLLKVVQQERDEVWDLGDKARDQMEKSAAEGDWIMANAARQMMLFYREAWENLMKDEANLRMGSQYIDS